MDLVYNAHRSALRGAGQCRSFGMGRIFAGASAVTFDRTRDVDAGEVRVTGLSVDDSFDSKLRVPEADLLVAGHTHGGQVRLPWIGPLVTFSSVPRGWAAGATSLTGGRWLVVSSGVGLERGPGPRLRFFCRPEIVVIHIDPDTLAH